VTSPHHLDYIIIGAGPAGMQLAYFLQSAGRSYVILEAREQAGGSFDVYPRHRTLLSLNKRHTWFSEIEYQMRHDWNSLLTDDNSHLFRDYSDELYPNADDLHRYLLDFATKYALNIEYGVQVTRIGREGHFVVDDAAGVRRTAERLIMATGPRRELLPAIEGIEDAETYCSHDLDRELYANKRVLIIGKGNSAFEVGEHLAGHAAFVHIGLDNKQLKMAWQTHFPGNLRAINNTILDMYFLKAQHALLGCSFTRIEKERDGAFLCHWEEHMPHWSPPGTVRSTYTYDHVIVCTGFSFVEPALFASEINVEVDPCGKFPRLSSSWESTEPGLYFIGTAMAARDRQAASSFIHGFRYNIRTLFRLLEHRYYGESLPALRLPLDNPDDLFALANFVLRRLSTAAALVPLFGVMCDVLAFRPDGVEYLYELPVGLVADHPELIGASEYITLTFELGKEHFPENADNLKHIHFPPGPACSSFAHARLRHFRDGVEVAMMPLDETLTIRYDATYSESQSTGPWPPMVINFLDRVAGLLAAPLPVPRYKLTFEPWGDKVPVQDASVPRCRETIDPNSLYMPHVGEKLGQES